MKKTEKKEATVKLVSNALKILEILSNSSKCGVNELAQTLGCQKGTVSRLLNTLKNEGYIIQDGENEKYYLSLKLFKIGSNSVTDLDFNLADLPEMTQFTR